MQPDLASASAARCSIEIVINNVLCEALRSGELDLVVGPSAVERVEEFVSHELLTDEVVVRA
jgi:hypothetical protein